MSTVESPGELIVGFGIPEGTRFIQPLSSEGRLFPNIMPIPDQNLQVVSRRLQDLSGEIAGFVPCQEDGKPFPGHEDTIIYVGMDFIADAPEGGILVSSRSIDKDFKLEEQDSAVLNPNWETPEGSRFRSAA